MFYVWSHVYRQAPTLTIVQIEGRRIVGVVVQAVIVTVEGVLVQVAGLLAKAKAERIKVQLSTGARLIIKVSAMFVNFLAQITPVVGELGNALIELTPQHVGELFQLRLVLKVRNGGVQRAVRIIRTIRITRTVRVVAAVRTVRVVFIAHAIVRLLQPVQLPKSYISQILELAGKQLFALRLQSIHTAQIST